jgi:hypothetical protein
MRNKRLYTTNLLHNTDVIRKLILENPDLPILVLVGDDANKGEYAYEAVWDVEWDIGEFLDCQQRIDEGRIYTDREEFENDLELYLWNEANKYIPEDEFETLLKRELEKYEPYWKRCIILYIG